MSQPNKQPFNALKCALQYNKLLRKFTKQPLNHFMQKKNKQKNIVPFVETKKKQNTGFLFVSFSYSECKKYWQLV